MLVNWNLLVSAVKLVSFERVTCSFAGVTCSFVGVTCSFDAITFRFVIPKWWILQHIHSGENSVEKGGGGSFANFRQICFDFAYYFILILYLCNCLIRRVCKKSFLSFSYFSMIIKKICKIKTNLSEIVKALPSPPEFPPLYSGCQKNESSSIFLKKLVIRLYPEYLNLKYLNTHIWSQICTLSTRTCTWCSSIASDIFALTFLPHSLKTLDNLAPYKHEHKG